MSEPKIIAHHAGTVLVGQLAVMAYGVTDTVVAGRYSDASLAALSVGSAIFISVYVALMGVMQALLPIWAEFHGAGRPLEVGRSYRQALYLCLVTIVLGMAVLLAPGPLLRWTDVPPDMRPEVERYLAVLALALPPTMLFRMFSTLNQSIGRPQLVTWLQIGALMIKIPVSIWFTFGGAGLPAQGVVGCAWATLVVYYVMAAIAAWLLKTQSLYSPYAIWMPLERLDQSQFLAFARLGVPNGLAIMVEVTSYTLMALYVARLGTQVTASHQIAANLAAVLYMVPLSIGIASSARVSYWLGADQPKQAKSAMRIGFVFGLGAALALSSLVYLGRNAIATTYSGSAAIVVIASPLLAFVALYHVFDAVQSIAMFYLRCFRVVFKPLVVYCVLLWGLGLFGGYQVAYVGFAGYPPFQSALAFWGAGAVALGATAGIFLIFLRRAARTLL